MDLQTSSSVKILTVIIVALKLFWQGNRISEGCYFSSLFFHLAVPVSMAEANGAETHGGQVAPLRFAYKYIEIFSVAGRRADRG